MVLDACIKLLTYRSASEGHSATPMYAAFITAVPCWCQRKAMMGNGKTCRRFDATHEQYVLMYPYIGLLIVELCI